MSFAFQVVVLDFIVCLCFVFPGLVMFYAWSGISIGLVYVILGLMVALLHYFIKKKKLLATT